MGQILSEILNDISDGRERRAMKTMFDKILNDDATATHKAIIYGAAATPISIAGAFTTGLEISADGTTAISVTSGFTGTTGISLAGTATDGIALSGACSTAVNVSVAQTAGDGFVTASVLQHGSYNTALAYGTVTDTLVMQTTHITATPASADYVMGSVNYIETQAASAGYIHVGYNRLDVNFDLVNGYASRGRVAIGDDCALGEQSACLASMEIGAHAITATGSATLTAGLFDLDITAGATVAQECACLEIRPRVRENGLVGSTCGMRINVNCEAANYVNFGLDIRSMSANQTAAIRILATPGTAALPVGIHIEGQSSTTSAVTHAISLVGTVTNAIHFNETDGSQAALTMGTYNSGYDETPIASIKVMLNGTSGYIYVHDTIIGVT